MHSRYDSSVRGIGLSQRPLPENTQHSQETEVHSPRWNSKPQYQQASNGKPRLSTAQPPGSVVINRISNYFFFFKLKDWQLKAHSQIRKFLNLSVHLLVSIIHLSVLWKGTECPVFAACSSSISQIFLVVGSFQLRIITTDSHIISHVNIQCLVDRYPKLNIYISGLNLTR